MKTVLVLGSKRALGFFFLLAVALLAFYFPVYTNTYLYSDDYCALYSFVTQDGNVRALIDAGGRQTAGFIVETGFMLAGQIANLGWLRFISVLGLVGLSWLVFAELEKRGYGTVSALLAGLLVALMPASLIFAFWTTLFSVSFAAILAALAAKTAEKLIGAPGRARKSLIFLGALVLQTLAFTWYQPSAVFYWPMVAILLFAGPKDNRGVLYRFCVYLAVFLTSAVISYGFVKYGSMVHPGMLGPGRGSLVHDVPGKLLWFIQTPLMMAFNFVTTQPSAGVALLSAVVIGVGFCLHLWQHGVLKVGLPLAIMILGLSYLPNLAVAENWATFRTQIALTSSVLVLFFFAISGYSKLLGGKGPIAAGAALLLFTGIMGYRSLDLLHNKLVRPQVTEYANLKAAVARHDFTTVNDVRVLLAPFPAGAMGDEILLPSMSVVFVPESAVRLLVRERGQDATHFKVQVTRSDEPIRTTAGVVLEGQSFFDYGEKQ